MQALSAVARHRGERVTLVPTMGYLHEGHASLIRRARRDGDLVVVSLFVNPTQFGPNEDYEDYPRDFDRDLALIEANGGDVVFAPTAEEMYPQGFSTTVSVDALTKGLCGASRPTHFSGVATVVTKLFASCRPDAAVFGQKDAQQAAVIRRLTADFNLGVDILVIPSVREADGLAKSSRNVYLTAEERRAAPVLFHALQQGKSLAVSGIRSRDRLIRTVTSIIETVSCARIEYVEAVKAEDLREEPDLKGPILLAVAVRFGKARLIDNVLVPAT
ncbi:MAG: pantoate--beta-alanine ligase [Gemmatimonadetes bacterium]|nr:pantoate--beta-alanine ligase [Gemmatimonadota bacterium]HCK11598.1 pantoate--beta-alanine ligase [Candidatus Latescibacterota bacterium]